MVWSLVLLGSACSAPDGGDVTSPPGPKSEFCSEDIECDDADPCTAERCSGLGLCVSVELGSGCREPDQVGSSGPELVQSVQQGQGGLQGLLGASAFAVSSIGDLYVAAPEEGRLTRLSWAEGRVTPVESLETGVICEVALTEDESRLYVLGDDRLAVYPRDLSTGDLGAPQRAGVGGTTLALHQDSAWLIGTGRMNEVRLDEAGVLSMGRSVDAPGTIMATSARWCGKPGSSRHVLLVSSHGASAVTFWTFSESDGAPTLLGMLGQKEGLDGVVGAACNPEGDRVAVVTWERGELVLFDWPSDSKLPIERSRTVIAAEEARAMGKPADEVEALPIDVGLGGAGGDSRALVVLTGRETGGVLFDVAGPSPTLLPSYGLEFAVVDYLRTEVGEGPRVWSPDSTSAVGSGAVVTAGDEMLFTSGFHSAVGVALADGSVVSVRQGDGGVDGLTGANNLDLSPDEHTLVVASRYAKAIASFRVVADGGAVVPLPIQAMPGPQWSFHDAVVSRPSGHLVHGLENMFGRVHTYSLDVDSSVLTPVDIAAVPPPSGGDQAFPVRMRGSPDGRSLYVGDFQRDLPSGLIEFAVDLATGHTEAVMRHEQMELGGIEDIIINADGSHVLAACYLMSSVVHFSRASDGGLTWMSPIVDDRLHGAEFLALSPDEKHLYVATAARAGDNLLSVLEVDLDGDHMTIVQSLSSKDGLKLQEAGGLSVAQNGLVWAASRADNAINLLEPGADGRLTPVTFAESADKLAWANDLHVSKSGHWLYVAAAVSDGIAVLATGLAAD